MMITELIPTTPWRTVPVLKNKWKLTRKLTKARIKKARRSTLLYWRRQYALSNAYSDFRAAARQNEDIFIAAITTVALVSYGITALAAQFLYTVFTVTYAFSETTGFDVMFVILLFGGFILAMSFLLAAFSINFVSYAVMDGANRKQYRSIRSTVRRSLRAACRLVVAWILYGLMIAARTVILLIASFIYIKWVASKYSLPPYALIGVGIMGAAWILAGMFKYSLVPSITQFEPDMLLVDAFSRSRQLTRKGSRVFLAVCSLSLFGYMAGLYALCHFLSPWIGTVSNLLFVVGIIAAAIILNCALLMLYRKRKYARTY